ncbi:MAG TPA: hypothetical protein VGL02_15820 [Streptomyces sp.]
MSQAATPPLPPPGHSPPEPTPRETAWAAGGTLFAGLLMLFGGVMGILEGIVGISKDSVYLVSRGDYTYKFDVSSWGWVHLVLGALAVVVGYGLLSEGAPWSRYGGMAIAGLSMIANFMFLPYQPVWAVIMIAIDIFVIWSLSTYHPGHGAAGTRAGGHL